MKNSYSLEIYEPKSDDTLLFTVFSDTVYPRFEKGDEIRHLYSKSSPEDKQLIVERVEYLVWETDEQVSFRTMVFTKEKPIGESKALIDPSN